MVKLRGNKESVQVYSLRYRGVLRASIIVIMMRSQGCVDQMNE